MAEQCAWVTLATNDSYCLGALVLAHSLRRVDTKYPLAILITPGVTPIMKDRLATVFSQVVTVDVLDSKDAAHLALLSRPELGITFTKLHCWNLTQFTKCVFLDADTLVFQNCDELFEREELSAAPDVGWPDCFNSGVFVYKPSKETFDALIKFAQEKGSFDGGDQGLLNQYFSDWARGDISKHLPFLYNVCSTAFYSYLPALKQFGGDMKIMHFIGSVKPWLNNFNWSSRTVSEEGYLQAPLQYWWNVFLENVHPSLDVGMVRWECGASNEARYHTPHNDESHFPWHHDPPIDEQQPSSVVPHPEDFYDPWESYTPRPAEAPTPSSSRRSSIDTNQEPSNYGSYEEPPVVYPPKAWYEIYTPEDAIIAEEWHDAEANSLIAECGPGGSHCGTMSQDCEYQNSECCTEWQQLNFDTPYVDANDQQESLRDGDCKPSDKPFVEEVKPRHPYDNYYLIHQPIVDNRGCKRCTHEELPSETPSPSPSPTPTPTLSVDTETDLQAGLAGALSQLTIGSSETTPAVEEHLRRQGWESGNIDYMGADSFDNIWAKISQTLSGTAEATPAAPAPEAAPAAPTPEAAPATPAPVAAPAAPTPVAAPASTPAPIPASIPEPVAAPQIPTPAVEPLKVVEQEPAKAEPSIETPAAPVVESATPTTEAVVAPTDSATQEPQATTDENQDSKQAETKATDIPAPLPIEASPSPKPIEKLVCHLKPTDGVEPLVTPENEYEDAASIAMRIIESEVLSSPIITSATPPISSSPVRPALPQNVKDLSIDTRIPETPPVSGPVSLAQIGIVPSHKSVQDTVKTPEAIIETPEPAMECPIKAPKALDIKKSVDVAPTEVIAEPAKVECALPKAVEIVKEPIMTICEIPKPATPTTESSECAFVSKEKVPESPAVVEESKEITAPPKSKSKKSQKKQPPPLPETEQVVAEAKPCEPCEIPPETPQKPKLDTQISTEACPIIKSEAKDADETAKPVAKPKKTTKKPQPSTPTETPKVCELKTSEPKVEDVPKAESAPADAVETKPADAESAKPKKTPKKPPALKKSDVAEDMDAKLEVDSKKGEDAPVPPPRKKEKKPKK